MSRDILDLAMLQPTAKVWKAGLQKAEAAYGAVILPSLAKARQRLLGEPQRLARCMKALQVHTPQALVYQRLVKLAV